MSRTLFLAVLTTVLALSACRSTPSGGDGFRTIAQGYQTGLRGVEPRTARTEAEWRKLWDEHASMQIPHPPAPRIDFAKEMVVCVLGGERPSGGYGIEVVGADFNGTDLVLGVRETRPAEDAIVPMVVTRPYHMVATPITNAGVRVEKR
jgi:hypothetical protein